MCACSRPGRCPIIRAHRQFIVFEGKMAKIKGLPALILWVLFTAVCGMVLVGSSTYLYLAPALPSVEQLRDVSFQIPLRVYSRDGKLIGEFGEKRRAPVRFDQLPPDLINAIVA